MATVAAPSTLDWTIDTAHTTAEFAVKHMMVATVRGRFEGITGSFHFDPANPSNSWVKASIPTASVSTGNGDRDAHLRSADFFNADEHPAIEFASSAVRHKGGDDYEIDGTLTIRGIARPVTLKAEYNGEVTGAYGEQRLGFAATTRVNRKDYDLTWNVITEAGGALVGDDVRITLDISANPSQA